MFTTYTQVKNYYGEEETNAYVQVLLDTYENMMINNPDQHSFILLTIKNVMPWLLELDSFRDLFIQEKDFPDPPELSML